MLLSHDPKHWRARAIEARGHAAIVDDPEAKRTMFAIAKEYERLAERAERHARGEKLD